MNENTLYKLTDISTNFLGTIVPLMIFLNNPLFFSSLMLNTIVRYFALYLIPTSLLWETYKSCSICLTSSSNLSFSILTSSFLLTFNLRASVKPLTIESRIGFDSDLELFEAEEETESLLCNEEDDGDSLEWSGKRKSNRNLRSYLLKNTLRITYMHIHI